MIVPVEQTIGVRIRAAPFDAELDPHRSAIANDRHDSRKDLRVPELQSAGGDGQTICRAVVEAVVHAVPFDGVRLVKRRAHQPRIRGAVERSQGTKARAGRRVDLVDVHREMGIHVRIPVRRRGGHRSPRRIKVKAGLRVSDTEERFIDLELSILAAARSGQKDG
jgi:hypothetical protein